MSEFLDNVTVPHRAGATLDDHTNEFTNACLGWAERLGTDLPLRAAELQIRTDLLIS